MAKTMDIKAMYLREAEGAIHKCTEVCDHYGNQTVLKKIEDLLREARGE